MTATTGMPSVADVLADAVEVTRPALEVAVEVTRPALEVPARVRRVRIPWPFLGADALAALSVAVVGIIATPAAWAAPAQQALLVAWPVAVTLCGGHAPIVGAPSDVRPRALMQAAALTALVAWTVLAISPSLLRGGTVLAARSTLSLVVALCLLSLVLRLVWVHLAPVAPRRVVLVGDASGIRSLLDEARRSASRGLSTFEPVAICVAQSDVARSAELAEVSEGLTVWPGTDDLLDVVSAHAADTVVVAPGSGTGHAELRRWGAWLQDAGAELLVSPGLRDVALDRLGLATLGGQRLLSVRPAAITGFSHRLKAYVDRVVAALLLLFLSPVLLILAVMIRRDSPGPAFYTQTRVGRDGQQFTVFKLRTMCAEADVVVEQLADDNESDGVLFKIKADPRITRLGGVLRKYSLDELPQLINVLRGEMSLVGPRPALPSEVAAYSQDLGRRLAVKPGMTGLWQVSGRSDLSWEDTVRLDLQYVDNWSWRLDLAIAVRTVRAVLGHHGAY